ncbi:hypothetical protein GQ54DRAFT_300615 [Martensiomyces pterosporus]|nr:hypothetical protein GQ54DRAFT_300615 [Martensiomyces pterosporus]
MGQSSFFWYPRRFVLHHLLCPAPNDDDEQPLLKRLLKAADMKAAKRQRKGHVHPQP